MKVVKVALFAMLAALVAVGFSTTSYAFHSGGVAECEGCHSMHSPKAGGSFLLVGSDQSSTCLTCHQSATDTGPNSYHISTADAKLATSAPLQMTPGGDFGWVKKTWSTVNDNAWSHGHNIIAADFNYVIDGTNTTTAPGGTFSSAQLGCQSCHDPHGQTRRTLTGFQRGGTIGQAVLPIMASGSYQNSPDPTATEAVGVYRILRGFNDASQPGANFTVTPIAVTHSSYNRSEAVSQVRTAYGSTGTDTWGSWCATCHADMHSTGNYVHKVDEPLGVDIANTYNAYKKSGDLTGSAATSFSSLVPFAETNATYTTLKGHVPTTGEYLNGPASTDRVMCLSCHRAHASGNIEALRFPYHYEFMTYGSNYIGMDNPLMTSTRKPVQTLGRNMADWQTVAYGRPASQFATYQRVLCNKCHAKD